MKPTDRSPRTAFKAILGLVIGLAVLGLWLYWIGFEDILATLGTVAPVPALAALAAWILSMGLRSWKWHILLLVFQDIRFAISGRVYWVSAFLNVIFPFRVGELTRSLLLKQLVDLPVSASLPTVLVDRLYSIAAILLGLLVLPLAPFRLQTSNQLSGLGMQSVRWGIGIVAALFLATLLTLYALRDHKELIMRLARRALFMLPDRWTDRILSFADAMVDSTHLSGLGTTAHGDRGPWRVAEPIPVSGRRATPHARPTPFRWRVGRWGSGRLGLLAWSLAVLLADAVKDHFCLRAFGLNVPLTSCFVGVCLTNLAFILPSPPGNIGSSEWYATLVYSGGFGYDPLRVAGGALFGHAMTSLVVAVGGALSLSGLGINLAESLSISQGRSVVDARPADNSLDDARGQETRG